MEQKFLEEIFLKFREMADIVWEHVDRLRTERAAVGAGMKRMQYYPDGQVYFLTVKESNKILDSYEEMGIIPIPEIDLYVVFNEDHVVEYEGRRYIAGPVIVRTDLDPLKEVDLDKYEIVDVLKRLEANEDDIRFGGVDIPVLALR